MIAMGKTIGQVVQASEIREQPFLRAELVRRNEVRGSLATEVTRKREQAAEEALTDAQSDKETLKEALQEFRP